MTGGRTFLLGALTFLLMLPLSMPVPVLSELVRERYGVSAGQTAWFMAANMLGALVTAPLIGLLGDRIGRRRVLVVAALLADAVLLDRLAHAGSFAELLAVRAAEGVAHIAALSLVLSLCADAAGERRGRVMGMLGAGLTLGVATGAPVGGALGRVAPEVVLPTGAGVLLAAAVIAFLVLPRDTGKAARPGLRAIINAVLAHRGMLLPLLFALADRFTVGFFTTGFPLLLRDAHGASPATIGAMLAAFLYPFALLSYPCGRLAERLPPVRLMAWGSLGYGLLVALVGLLPLPWLWALMPLLGLCSAVMFVPTMLLTVARAPAIARATALAAFNGAGSLGFLLGPLACGAILDLAPDAGTGFALAFGTAGLAEVLCVLLLVLGARRKGR